MVINIRRGEKYLTCFSFASLKTATFLQDEEMVSDPEQLLEQVLASHEVRIENGQYPNKYLITTPHKSHKYVKVSSAWTGKK